MIIWSLISINPFLTAIMSEVILVEEQSLFITKNMLFGGNPSLLLSPWIIYTAIYILLTLLMIFLSIQRVKRPDR
jgi:hypothetical protein